MRMEERIFTDEIIPRSAERLEAKRTEEGSLPERIRKMLEIGAKAEANGQGEERVFRLQAEYMADWDLSQLHRAWFSAYYPTYARMSGPQLLSYFSWRTRWKAGERKMGAPVSFAFVHVYELLNGAGAQGPRDAWEKLSAFWEDYRKLDFTLDRYVPQWLDDLVVYDGLDQDLMRREYVPKSDREVAEVVGKLEAGVEFDEDPQFAQAAFVLLNARSTYKLERSSFWAGHEREMKRLALEAFLKLRARRAFGTDRWFGTRYRRDAELFASAVFDFSRRPEDRTYVISPFRRWVAEKGSWRLEELFPERSTLPEIGAFLKVVDAELRKELGNKRKLSVSDPTGEFTRTVRDVLDEGGAERRKAANPVRQLDFGRLAGIRADALETQEKLIVEEPAEEAPSDPVRFNPGMGENLSKEGLCTKEFTASEIAASAGDTLAEAPKAREKKPAVAAAEESKAPDPADLPGEAAGAIAREDRALLQSLLQGRVPAALPGGMSAEMTADRLNEALYDAFGDAVLEVVGGKLSLIEDYAEDLADFLQKFRDG